MPFNLGKRRKISEIRRTIPREEILRRSRVLVVDDERPEIIDDLEDTGFAVDHLEDVAGEDCKKIEQVFYDLVILDYSGVGKSYGDEEGLSLLRHIKRVNPVTVVLVYTSQFLPSEKHEFYTLADGVISKDAGIAETTQKVEEALQQAHSIQRVWSALLTVTGIEPGTEKDFMFQNAYVRGVAGGKGAEKFVEMVRGFLESSAAQEAGMVIVTKLVELGIKAVTGL